MTTPTLVIDWSFANVSVMVLKPYHGVMRYVSPDPGKNLTVAEAAALHTAGKWIGLVWEATADRAKDGTAAGTEDAHEANRQADRLGYPKNAVIFYAVDFDATPSEVEGYFGGIAAEKLRPMGVYGGIKITSAGIARYNWQTAAWSGGKVDAKANLYQRLRATVPNPPPNTDENVLLNPFPAWGNVAHHSPTFPHIVAALQSNKAHAADLRKIKATAAKHVANATLAALTNERKEFVRIVKKG